MEEIFVMAGRKSRLEKVIDRVVPPKSKVVLQVRRSLEKVLADMDQQGDLCREAE